MARKAVIERNKKRRRMIKKHREERERLKAEGKWEELQKLPKNSSPTRLQNRSFLSGRARGFMRDFGVDRIEFRELVNEGKIPGVKKSSW